MNKDMKDELQGIIDIIEEAQYDLEDIVDNLQDKYDSLSEASMYGDKGEQMEEEIDSLENACHNLEDTLAELCSLLKK